MPTLKAYRIEWFETYNKYASQYQQEYFRSIMDAASRMEALIADGFNPTIDTIEII